MLTKSIHRGKTLEVSGVLHSSLHQQGAHVCVQAHLLQVDGSLPEDGPATPEVHLAEQDDGGQRKLLNKKRRWRS